jgi:hypothetical protein
MSYKQWAEKKMKKMDVYDMKLIKWSVAAFTLMLASIWPVLISWQWYWYGLLGVLFMWRPMMKTLGK